MHLTNSPKKALFKQTGGQTKCKSCAPNMWTHSRAIIGQAAQTSTVYIYLLDQQEDVQGNRPTARRRLAATCETVNANGAK